MIARLTRVVLVSLAVAVALAAVAAWLGGFGLHVVTTGSMEPEIPVGSLVATRPVAPRSVHAGDVVAFADPGDAGRTILHRVVRVNAADGRQPRFTTQGDANASPDFEEVRAGLLRGRQLIAIPRVGTVVRFLSDIPSWLRWLLFVFAPLAFAIRRPHQPTSILTEATA